MQLRHWSVFTIYLPAVLLAFSGQSAFAAELPQDQVSETRGIAAAPGTQCKIFGPGYNGADVPETCLQNNPRISGHVRVDMGSRLPSGPNEVWPGAQILPVRANVRDSSTETPGHLHLGMSESSGRNGSLP